MTTSLFQKLAAAVLILSAMPAWAYTVQIVEPELEQAYLRPAQSIDIAVRVDPKPTPLHTLVVRFDGNYLAANVDNLSLPTIDYELGQHTITAQLQSETGQVIAQDSRTIYIIPQNNLIRQERERQKAYEALPWYKKLSTRERPEHTLNSQSATTQGIVTPTYGVNTLQSGVPTLSGVQTTTGVATGSQLRPVNVPIEQNQP